MILHEQIETEILELLTSAEDRRLRPHDIKASISEKLGISRHEVMDAIKGLVKQKKLAFSYRDPCSFAEIPSV